MKALVYTGEKNLIYQDYSDPIKNKDEEIGEFYYMNMLYEGFEHKKSKIT